jgi:biotin carboxyl carrier protein
MARLEEEGQGRMSPNTIKSPFPGTFYRRANPQADPYVSEGDTVSPGQAVGLVEIMKNFHEIQSENGGVVVRILVENEDLVEAGQDIIELGD